MVAQASPVRIVTGHQRDPERQPSWDRLRGDTVVVLMGSARLADLTRQMLDARWDPDTPAAVVAAATTPRQRHLAGRLGDLAALGGGAGLGSPAVLVVGEVVSLSPELMGGLLAAAGVGG